MNIPKSILVHLDATARARERVTVARTLAQRFDAQVNALACTRSAVMSYAYDIQGAAEAVAVMLKLDDDLRKRIRSTFLAASENSPRMHWENPTTDIPWGFATRALYCDLMILGQPDADDPDYASVPADFIPYTLVASGKPALILPYAGPIDEIGQNVLVAWKETPEAAHAVTAALPWLRNATQVHAVSYGADTEQSLHALQGYLAAEGVHTATHPDNESGRDCAPLLSLAADLGSDLIVMGCYGHSRVQEWALGGFTRSMLQSMTVPILMSH